MRILGIETSTVAGAASVALIEGGKVVLERAHVRPKQSAERLLPLIAELLSEVGWQRTSLDRLGVSASTTTSSRSAGTRCWRCASCYA